MFIKNFGLFWRADEAPWYPGKGGAFRLLGRRGENLPGLRVADFRPQTGIYILYNDYGPYYVGLTTKLGLGNRLKHHTFDKHADKWNRFSWFGFCRVLIGKHSDGTCKLATMAERAIAKPDSVITDVEALLIRAMGLSNIIKSSFSAAKEWTQIQIDESDHYLGKLG